MIQIAMFPHNEGTTIEAQVIGESASIVAQDRPHGQLVNLYLEPAQARQIIAALQGWVRAQHPVEAEAVPA